MRAVVARELGPPDGFSIEEIPDAEPGPGEARVAVKAAGIAFVDVLVATGQYQLKPPVPFVPGTEIAGIVEAVGPGVDERLVGQRVIAVTMGGAFAEKCIVRATDLFSMSDRMSFEEGAVFFTSYATAYHALVDRANLQVGESVVILGAGGAVGLAAVQIAKALGAFVIASASSEEKRAMGIESGADAAIVSRASDWRNQVKMANGSKPVDVVLDPVSGEETENAFRSLGWGGRHLIIGFASGSIARLPVNLPLLKGAAMIGVDIRQALEKDLNLKARIADALFKMFEQGKLKPRIAKSYAIEQFATAMKAVASGKDAGRTVLVIDALCETTHDEVKLKGR